MYHIKGRRGALEWVWQARLEPGVEIDRIAANIGLLPAILDACGVPKPRDMGLEA